jgi:hypothetical protein
MQDFEDFCGEKPVKNVQPLLDIFVEILVQRHIPFLVVTESL